MRKGLKPVLLQQRPGLTLQGMLLFRVELRPLQERLKPILLRRMKEDVETLPEKEEIVVWVQLTKQQLVYYKALMSKEVRWWCGARSGPPVDRRSWLSGSFF